jgi:hypothetical protein
MGVVKCCAQEPNELKNLSMRKILLMALLALSLVFGQAADVVLTWTASDTNTVKYNVYAIMNRVTNRAVTVDWPSNTTRVTIKDGVQYKFNVTAENKNHIESGPSPTVDYVYPNRIPTVPYITVRSASGTTSNAWLNVKINWSTPAVLAIKTSYVHFETGSTTNVYATRTNSFTMKTLPFNSYRIYVQAENVLGMSPYSSNSVVNLNRGNAKKLLEEEK